MKQRESLESQDDAAPQRRGEVCIRLSRASLVALIGAILGPWLALAGWQLGLSWGRMGRTDSVDPGPVSDRTFTSDAGPWGKLNFTRISIEPPEEFIAEHLVNPGPVKWHFANCNKPTLARLLDSTDLTQAQKNALLKTEVDNLTTNTCTIEPPREVVLEMSPKTRTTIYTILAANPENAAQNDPFRFRAGAFDEWFEASDLPDSAVAMVKKLLYQRGTSLVFSDAPAVLPTLPTADLKQRLIKTLSRKRTLLAKLEITPDTNIEKLLDYWAKGGRAKDIRPLLESLRKVPQGTALDINHLLPPFARRRLYTYPLPSTSGEAVTQDCHWTSMNFFKDDPDKRYNDINFVREDLEKNYFRLPGENYRYGDVLLFMQSETEAIHSVVYIADDIVYTKNGPTFTSPFILMRLPDCIAFYPSADKIQIVAYRPKDF